MRKAASLAIAALGGATAALSWPVSLAVCALGWRLWPRSLFLAAVLQAVLLASCFTVRVDSTAYEPTLPCGCRVVVARFLRPLPGRVVLLEEDGARHLARVLAGPGTAVSVRGGRVRGTAWPPLRKLPSRLSYSGVVPPGGMFVADYRMTADGFRLVPLARPEETAGVGMAALGPGWRFAWLL